MKGNSTHLSIRHLIIGVIATILTAMAMSPNANARKIKTRHTLPKETAKNQKDFASGNSTGKENILSQESDSIVFSERIAPGIRFYGFDKTVGSSIESFFISNGLEETLTGLEVEITYTDMKGRQLHKRVVHIDCDIPSGETMRTDIKSWDNQKSFYFHQSVKPKRQATPFDVIIRPLSVTCRS